MRTPTPAARPARAPRLTSARARALPTPALLEAWDAATLRAEASGRWGAVVLLEAALRARGLDPAAEASPAAR